jgi:hypothetical protein
MTMPAKMRVKGSSMAFLAAVDDFPDKHALPMV